MAMLTFAQDRRTVDQDGRLHVPGCRISKANVCPYYGREIPGWEALGLDGARVYHMYRDPAALAEAAASFENIPLMLDHIAITADAIPAELIGGTVSNPRYEHPYLVADVCIWTREGIDGVESEDKKELSCAYRYVPHMIAGTSPDGVRFDGKMVGPILANHVALVAEGRAGPDVVIADEVSTSMKTARFPKFMAALAALVGSSVSADALTAMDSALAEEIGTDDLPELTADEQLAALDAACAASGKEKDKLSDEEKAAAYKSAAKDKKAKGVAPAGPVGGAPKPGASDAATVQLAVDAAVALATKDMISKTDAEKLATDAATAARTEVLALVAAREAVETKVGVVALDSAEAVYRFALDKLKVPHADVPAVALAALFAGVSGATIAADAQQVPAVTVVDLFPNLKNIRRG